MPKEPILDSKTHVWDKFNHGFTCIFCGIYVSDEIQREAFSKSTCYYDENITKQEFRMTWD